nr:hypothetical protein [Tanacetum cinerariifolium]
MYLNPTSGNLTFSLHKEIASPEVIPEFNDSKGCTFLSEELPDIDSFNDIHSHFDDDPLNAVPLIQLSRCLRSSLMNLLLSHILRIMMILDFSKDDDLTSPDNEDKFFNPGILIHEKSVKIITHFAQEKKLAVSYASLLFENFDPPFYELLVFKKVPNSMRLLPFSSENEEKVFKPGIYTSKK